MQTKITGEAWGWCLDGGSRGATIAASIFFSTALLGKAKEIADADGNLFGTEIKASNILVTSATISGLLSAIIMPVIGALIDHTNHRWHFAAYSALYMICMNVFQFFLDEMTMVGFGIMFFCQILSTL